MSEATSRGAKIGDILAVDEDEGVNGVVTYSVISDWANDVFNVDPHTGAFSLTGKLDYEEVSVRIRTLTRLQCRTIIRKELSFFFPLKILNDFTNR